MHMPQAPITMDLQDVAALDSIARQLADLWQALSCCITQIEAGMQTSDSAQGDGAARVLPPGAAQVRQLLANPRHSCRATPPC